MRDKKGRLLNTEVEEHEKNRGTKCNYYNVLSDIRKKYADHDFDWDNIEILQPEINKGKKNLWRCYLSGVQISFRLFYQKLIIYCERTGPYVLFAVLSIVFFFLH